MRTIFNQDNLTSKHITWGFLALVFLVFIYSLTSSDESQAKAKVSKTTRAALSVNTEKVKRTMLDLSVPANGNIAPWQEAVIGAEVNGLQLKEVLVNVGDNVKRGQVLARFSLSTIQADIAQATANLAEAKAAAIEAASNASRARSIQDTGALSTQQVQQFISAEASTKARVEAAEASLKLQQVKLAQASVIAPDSGVISARTATVGAVAAAGQELFRLVRQGRLEWRAELTSADIGKIKVGMTADLTLPDGNTVLGKVRAVAPSIDSQTRYAFVYVDLPSSTAKAGMYARGHFKLQSTEALTLPAEAIVMRDGFAYVMQVDENQRIKQIKVQTGRRSKTEVEVLNLPDVSADYVASGGAFLADGDTVKVIRKTDAEGTTEDGKFTDHKVKTSDQ